MTKIGIITCENRSILCAGLNCFRAILQRSGTFATYSGDVEIVGFTTCGGCPGHLAPKKAESMIKYGGAEKIHLSCCVFSQRPDPNKSLKEIKRTYDQVFSRPIRLNQDDFIVEGAKLLKSGQWPRACFFKEKMKEDIAKLGVEVVKGTHEENAVDIKGSSPKHMK